MKLAETVLKVLTCPHCKRRFFGFTEDEVKQKYDNHLKEDKHLHSVVEEVGPEEKGQIC